MSAWEEGLGLKRVAATRFPAPCRLSPMQSRAEPKVLRDELHPIWEVSRQTIFAGPLAGGEWAVTARVPVQPLSLRLVPKIFAPPLARLEHIPEKLETFRKKYDVKTIDYISL